MTEMVLAQLTYEAPLLIVYLVGVFLALSMRRRYPRPCRFMGMGTALLLAVAILNIFQMNVFAVMEELRLAFDAHWQQAWFFEAIGLVGYLIQPLGIGLLFAAVLVGRSHPQLDR